MAIPQVLLYKYVDGDELDQPCIQTAAGGNFDVDKLPTLYKNYFSVQQQVY